MPDFDNSFLSQEDHPAVHEDALVFELNGQTLGWRASGLALKRAADQGTDVGEVLVDLQTLFAADLEEEDLEEMSEEEIEEAMEIQAGVADFLSLVAKTVWIGTLHFEPGARRENVLAILDASVVEEVPLEKMLSKIFPAIEDEVSEGKEPEATSGS